MASANETVLLKSTLEINNKPYSVKLTPGELYWEKVSSSRASGGPYSEPLVKTENQTVKLNEVIAVRLESGRILNNEGKFQQLEMVPMSSSSFSVHVVRRVGRHRWRERKVTFSSSDSSIAQQWVEKIQQIISKPEWNRPKNLLVFINPIGGRKRGAKIYAEKVSPLFDLAGINAETIVTQRANHARDHLLECDLSKYDGVVCVGGDGMLSELMHGLLTRAMRESGLDHLPPGTPPVSPSLRIGIIPGGSTDTVAWTSIGINDPATSAIHIILGDSIGVDVATIHHGNQFLRYNISLLGYGYFGDCIVDSENLRWMGPKRYDWSGFTKLLAHRSYEGEISYVQSPDLENHPKDGSTCRAGCQVCQAQPASPDYHEAEQWQKIKGRFLGINSFVISCRCGMCPAGPASAAHLGDGCLDLVLVKECSRVNYARFLYRCRDKSADQFDFSFIQTIRVKAFSFRPLVDEIDDTHESADSTAEGAQRLRSRVSHNSVWNCDGEVIDEPAIDVRCYRQAIRVFARGIEEDVSGPRTCLCCAKSIS